MLRHLRQHGCVLKREGASHSLWTNPATGAVEAVPRHTEIANLLARKICRGLGIPEIGQPRRLTTALQPAAALYRIGRRRLQAQVSGLVSCSVTPQ